MIVANPSVKTVELLLPGEKQPRHLLFDFNALSIAEAATGKSYLEPKAWRKLGVADLRALLWAALLHEDEQVQWDDFGRMTAAPKLTLAQCGRAVQELKSSVVFNKLMEAYKASSPEVKKDEQAPQAQPDPPKAQG